MAGDRAKRTATRRRTVQRAACGAVVVLASNLAGAQTTVASADDAIGEWRTPAAVNVQVRTCGETVCARIVKVPDPSLKDLNNPEPRLRPRPVLGIQIFVGERRTGTGGWKGHMYMPGSGYTYVSRLVPLEGNRLQAETCGPMGFFCTKEVWVRTR